MGKDSSVQFKKKVINLAVITAILALIILAFTIPVFMRDGTENYTGAEKRAAVAQLHSAKSLVEMRQKILEGIISYHVEKVFKTPPDLIKSWCGANTNSSEDIYYSVTLSERTFLGIKTSEFTRHDTCILL